MTCPFAPPKPNEFTLTRLSPDLGQLMFSRGSASRQSDIFNLGFNLSNPAVGTNVPCSRHRRALKTPASPEQPSVCPTLALMLPIYRGSPLGPRCSPKVEAIPVNSIGSLRTVRTYRNSRIGSEAERLPLLVFQFRGFQNTQYLHMIIQQPCKSI